MLDLTINFITAISGLIFNPLVEKLFLALSIFFPSKAVMPALYLKDKVTNATRDLIKIICNTGPATSFLEYGPKATTSYEQFSDIFSTNTVPKQ